MSKAQTREIIRALTLRLSFAERHPELSFSQTFDTQKEATTLAISSKYLDNMCLMLNEYYATADIVTGIHFGILDCDILTQISPQTGRKVKKYLASIQEEKAKNPNYKPQEKEADLFQTLADEKDLLYPSLFNTCAYLQNTNDPGVINSVLENIHILNEAYYHLYLPYYEAMEEKESGNLSGFKQAYLYVEQALDDIKNLTKNMPYQTQKSLSRNKFRLIP